MENNFLIELFFLFQILNFVMIFAEQDFLLKKWNEANIRRKVSLVIMANLPFLVIISLYFRPL